LCESTISEYVSILGLVFDASGAGLVLVSDLKLLKKHFIPEDKIQAINSAREKLHTEDVIKRGDPGYLEVHSIIESNFSIGENIDIIKLGKVKNGVVLRTDSRTCVYGYKNQSSTSTKKIIIENGESILNELEECGAVAPLSLLDALISQRVVSLEREAIQAPLKIGLTLLIIGFGLQIVSVFL
jgi:hypothetical protein